MKIPDILLDKTFVIQYSPNCIKKVLVRLVAPGKGVLDLKQYFWKENRTADILGFGDTIEEAARIAIEEQNLMKRRVYGIRIK